MEKTARRKMVLSNLVFDLTEKPGLKPFVQDVLQRVAKKWDALSTADEEEGIAPERLVREAVEEVIPTILCAGPVVDDPDVLLSRVTDAAGWYDNTVAVPIAKRDEIPDDILQHISDYGLQPHEIRPGAQVRGGWPQAWVTRKQDLDAFCAKCQDREMLAAYVRDYLGLIHYDDDQQLIRIDYPPDALGTTPLRAPTIFDGCGTRVYRSMFGPDKWGKSVNLADPADGAPEAVHSPIEFSIHFKITYLGRIAGRTHHFMYRELVASCPRPWQHGDEEIIESLL